MYPVKFLNSTVHIFAANKKISNVFMHHESCKRKLNSQLLLYRKIDYHLTYNLISQILQKYYYSTFLKNKRYIKMKQSIIMAQFSINVLLGTLGNEGRGRLLFSKVAETLFQQHTTIRQSFSVDLTLEKGSQFSIVLS